MTDKDKHYIHWFRKASPYIHDQRGKTFVVMIPGVCIQDSCFFSIVNDLALLNSLGVRLIVVHGARQQIDDVLTESKVKSEFHRGLRVTENHHMPAVLKAVGQTRFMIEAAFSSGLPNSPMHGAKIRLVSGNFISAMPMGIHEGVDYHYTGKVRNVDQETVLDHLDNDSVVIVSPLGYSLTGETFNLSFSDIAIQIATAVNADKLIVYNDDGAVCDDNDVLLKELTLLKCERFLVEHQTTPTNTYFSLKACYDACDKGIARAHVISSKEDGSLLKEIYTLDGSGTMVYRDNYETIRRASIADVMGILSLIEPLEQNGALVKRSRELLETEITCFTVMEKDGRVIGCAALYPINDTAGELACVAIHSEYQGNGRARKLLKHVEKQALKNQFERLYVLTTQTSHWFLEQGFAETHVEMLPLERQKLYNYQRRSKVFVKQVNPAGKR